MWNELFTFATTNLKPLRIMNITDEQWTQEEEDELTVESLVSKLLNASPTLDNYLKGVESMQILLQEEVDKYKFNQ
jgi:hypothetical protein